VNLIVLSFMKLSMQYVITQIPLLGCHAPITYVSISGTSNTSYDVMTSFHAVVVFIAT